MASLGRRRGSRKWIVRYTDLDGRRKQQSTGTTDKRVADRIRREIERELAERSSGLVDDRTLVFQAAAKEPIESHIESYLMASVTQGNAGRRLQGKQRHLEQLLSVTKATRLAEIMPDDVRAWMLGMRDAGLAPSTINEYRTSVNAFLNWCVKDGRLRSNPIKHVQPLPTRGDRRRNRRALDDREVDRLLRVALEQDSINAGRNWQPRREVYLVALYTGLRRKELGLITWRDLDFEARTLRVREEVSKARRQDDLPLHESVIEALSALPRSGPMDPVFSNVPTIRTFKQDCQRAGIALRDEAGRTVDFHSLRMTYCTRLIRAGVAAPYVQRLMRHADIKTTNVHYTDLRLHDLDGAISKLSGPIGPVGPIQDQLVSAATGTDDFAPANCHQNCHHTLHETVQSGASGCESKWNHSSTSGNDKPRRKAGLCDTMHDRASKRVRRFERPTFTLAT